jgi:DNA-binding transcriptional LysR family regulator
VNLKQLTAFCEVMSTGSVSEAARNLNRTQPAVSALIAGLEEDAGCRLLERRGRRLHPVPEAHYLFEEAQQILGRLERTEQTLRSLRELERGVLRIVSMPGPSVFLLPDMIARFVEGHDDVEVSLLTRSSTDVPPLIAAQQFDIGLADVGFMGATASLLVNHEIVRFECLCAMHAGDPLAGKETITARDLDGKPIATLYTDHPTYDQTKIAWETIGASFNKRFETQYFIPLFTFVERGLAYSIVDPLSAESYKLYREDEQRIVFRPFRPVIYLVASIMTPAQRPLSNLANAFAATLLSEFQQFAGRTAPP